MKIGVVSDTHIPDRAAALHPNLIGELQRSTLDLILHAGDISTPAVLKELEKVAPVKAVAGNRDFLFAGNLKKTRNLRIKGVKIVLTHGHLNFLTYWWDKMHYLLKGYNRDRIIHRLASAFPKAKLIIFGHTHRAENYWAGETLFFNPGSVTIGDLWVRSRSYGIIEIGEDGEITSQIVPLTGYELVDRKWQASEKVG